MTMELNLDTDLIVVTRPNALETFTAPDEVDKIVALVRTKANADLANLRSVGLYTVETEEGRKAIASLAHKVTKSRTALEKIGEDLTRELKLLPNRVIAGKNKFTADIEAIRNDIRKPLNDYEEAEEKRKNAHVAAIEKINEYSRIPFGTDAATLRGSLAAVEAIDVGPHCEEFLDGYTLAKRTAVETITKALAEREKYEADQAEIAALREKQRKHDEEEAERLREQRQREREEQVAKDAREKAQREADAASAQREADLKRQVEEANAKAAQEKAAAEAEAKRIADAKAADEAEQARRERSRNHRGAVNAAAVQALMSLCSLTAEQAKVVITAIAQGKITAVKIEY